jgi:hypothetical protein
VRVFENIITENMTPNFAPKGNIVASVPTGTGVLVMANRNVHVFDNVIDNHGTANVMIIGYRNPFDDPKYDPLPRNVVVYGNQHGQAGFAPAMEGGKELAAALGGRLPPMLWDGSGANIIFGDDDGAISLGLADPKAGMAAAKPAPVTPIEDAKAAVPAITPVVLPASMEAKVK